MSYPAVLQSEFKRPTLLPATLQLAWTLPCGSSSDGREALAKAAESAEGVSFVVLTEDGAKEVLVGRLSRLRGSGEGGAASRM